MGGLEEGGGRKGERQESCQKVEIVERLILMILTPHLGNRLILTSDFSY